MTERTPPPTDKFASYPYDGKILSFYEGQFDCVYILLHPFIKPINIDIERFCPETYPSKQDIIASCEPVSWQEVLKKSGLPSLSAIDIGLRTIISGLKQKFANQEFAEQIDAMVEQHHIVYPSEGDFPELLENRILQAIKTLGHNWLWVGDEFGTERKLYWVDDLIAKNEIPIHGCVFTHDNSLLVATHWDSHCSFLCSSKDIIQKILSVDYFEGFYCTPKTEVYWGLSKI